MNKIYVALQLLAFCGSIKVICSTSEPRLKNFWLVGFAGGIGLTMAIYDIAISIYKMHRGDR